MFRFLLLTLLVALALAVAIPKDTVPELGERIVGGHEIEIEDAPWQVSIINSDHRCGGSIITENTILTAAHCICGSDRPSWYLVRAGCKYKSEKDSQERSGRLIICHPNYNSKTVDSDIGLLIVAPFEFNSKVQPIAMPWSNEEASSGSKATITGWGALREGGKTTKELRSVDVTVVSNEECQKAYRSKNNITVNMMCAGERKGGRDSCQGDSGGPLVVENKLFGIISWGYGCARRGYPGVYTRVATFREWIDDNAL